jgi:hypothetical protein
VEDLMTDIRANRRELLQATAGLAGASLLGALGISPTRAAEMAKAAGRSEKPLKAAFSNIGLQVSWCTQGKQAAEYWGKLFNVEVTWFDGALSDAKQLAAIEDIANQKWDFVAIQPFSIGTLKAPVEKMIKAGVPVIDMDTLIAPLDEIDVHSFLAPDNEFMGAAVTQVLMESDWRPRDRRHDARRIGPHRSAGTSPRLLKRRQEISQDRSGGHDSRQLERGESRQHLGSSADQIPKDRRGLLSQRRHGARRLRRDEASRPYRRLRWHAAGARRA